MKIADRVVLCEGWSSDPHWWPAAPSRQIIGQAEGGMFQITGGMWYPEEHLMMWDFYIATRTLSEGDTDDDEFQRMAAELGDAIANTRDSIIHSILRGKKP